jgi:polysaccharide export outer membrane protein
MSRVRRTLRPPSRALALGAFLLAGPAFVVCARGEEPASQARRPQTQTAPAQPQAPPQASEPAVGDYEIGPNDILRVTVYGHEDLTQTVLVQADGTFNFPLIGRVKAEGLTTKQLEQKIATLLARGYIRNPQVTAVVQEFRSKNVFVVGEIARPGTYPLSGRLTLVEILAKAGPISQTAGAEVVIVRPKPGASVDGPVLPTQVEGQTEPNAEVIRINVRDLQTGALEENVELKANDTVFVPQAPKVFVSGEVRNPGAYAWFPGLTARQLITLAGGLTPEGSDSRLKVVRDKDGKPHEEGIKRDDTLSAGETLVVRRKLF